MRFILLIWLSTFSAYAQNSFPMRDIRQSAETSQAAVSLNLALSLIDGRGVARNLEDAEDILNDLVKSRSSAHPQSVDGRIVSVAYVTLAKLNMHHNPAKAHGYLRHSAVYYGNAEGQYLLGKHAHDPKIAMRWWSLAANKGYPPAMVDLGKLLFEQNNPPRGLMYLMLSVEQPDKIEGLRLNFPEIYDKSTQDDRLNAKLLIDIRQKK